MGPKTTTQNKTILILTMSLSQDRSNSLCTSSYNRQTLLEHHNEGPT